MFKKIRDCFNNVVLCDAYCAVSDWADAVPRNGSGIKHTINRFLQSVPETDEGWSDFLIAAKSIILASGSKSFYGDIAIKKIERAGKIFGDEFHQHILCESRDLGDELIEQWYRVRTRVRA